MSLISFRTLGLIVAAVIILGLLRGRSRQLAFLCINAVFLIQFLLGARGTVITFCFILAGYILIVGVRKYSGWAFRAGLPAFVLFFVYMKNYSFLGLFLPPNALTSTLSTVGLSFLFFKIVHLVIEAQSRTLQAFDGLSYACYCTNFATFTMGPIQRYQDHRLQSCDPKIELTFEQNLDAVIRILVGMVKAHVLAELFKPYMITADMTAADVPILQLLFSIYAFNAYLYLNFAGYCDAMIGAGTLFGLQLPENFDKPFLARNVSDFWQRQHRSLTLWLTDYVYTPTFKRLLQTQFLRKRPLTATNLSLMATMLVSGLWHGTSLAFLIFGLLHGLYLVVYRTWDTLLTKKFGKEWVREWRRRWWVHSLGVFMTFNAVSFAFVFFQLGAREGVLIFARFLWP